jgi:hypothetical protein
MAQITMRHNLDELYEMGYQPTPGEIFMRYGKPVTFVEIDPTIRYLYGSIMTKDGRINTKTDTGKRGVIYRDEKGRKMSCYPMGQLQKEVTYEVIFK